MNKRKILVCDDEVYISEMLKDILLDLDYEVTGTVSNTQSAIKSIELNKPDLAILDIKMNGRDQGFEIAKYLNENGEIPYIFLTSFSDASTVKQASEYIPKAYLVKPFNEHQIFSTLEIVFKKLEKKKDYIVIKDGVKMVKILVEDIYYLHASDKYIELVTLTKKYLLRETLAGFMEKYKLASLIQVHRSFLIHKEKISSVMRNAVIINKTEIPVSRSFQSSIDDLFNE